MKKNIKILLLIPALIILGLVSIYAYDFIKYDINVTPEEQEKREIDEYNFTQLKKVKSVLDKLDKNSYTIKDLDDFNEQFDMDINPIKYCYYIEDINRHYNDNKLRGGYIFGFKLESQKYIDKYWTEYFAYPKYNLPKYQICDWECSDYNIGRFEYIITHSCDD